MRIGFQGRLDLVRQKIEGVPVPPRPKKLAATFGGEPIIDNYGIDANFAAEAVTFFSDTIRLGRVVKLLSSIALWRGSGN